MKLSSSKHFLERGYLQFPYIIVRKFPTLYVQVPIHRSELKGYFSEGIFIPKATEDKLGYEESCHTLFESYVQHHFKKNGSLDMCLVLNPDLGHFISINSKFSNNKQGYKQGTIPWGGMLFTCNGELIRMNEQHYMD